MDGTRFSGNITPAGDAEFDEFNRIIDSLVESKLDGIRPYLATVTSTRTADARIRVQAWEDDADGQEDKIRAAGFAVAVGDNVVVLPIGGGEAVIISKLVNSNADKKVITKAELADNAVDSDMLANGSIKTAHLDGSSGSEAVTSSKIRDRAVTPAKLDRAYATQSDIDSATNNMATQSYVNNKVSGLQPSGNYATVSYVDTKVSGINTGGGSKSFDEVKNGRNTLKEYFQQIQLFFNCTNNNLGSKLKKKKPCEAYRVLNGFG